MLDGTITKKFISIGNAQKVTGLGEQILRNLFDKTILAGYTTPKGQRMYNIQALYKFCNMSLGDDEKQEPLNIIYGRVSTKKQSEDLLRQLDFIKSNQPKYADYIIISDIGSGINFKRKGIETILDACLQRNIGEVVIAHRDRLCRFGYDIFEQLITKAGGTITVIDDENNKSTEQELAEDLLSIVHIYSCRQMGKRKYSKRGKNTDVKNIGDTSETK